MTAFRPVTTAEGLTFTPWTDGYAVGFRVTREQDDRVEYVALNPSSEHDRSDYEGRGDVFLYHAIYASGAERAGEQVDALGDCSVSYLDVFDPADGPDDAPAAAPAVPDREGCTPIAELDAMAADTYPHRGEDAATLARLGVADDVAARVLDYLAMLNRQDAEDCKRNGYWFARSDLFTVEQPARARKYVRLMTLSALTPAAERRERGGSVVCFLEIGTGRLRQADGWKGPGPRVIGDLSTDEGAARLR